MSENLDTGNAAGTATAPAVIEMDIPLDEIHIPDDRMRQVGDTKLLEQSLASDGLLQKIKLRLNPDFEGDTTGEVKPYILVYGLHRYVAAHNIGWTEIPAKVENMEPVDAKIQEVVENLIRNELTTLERAKHLAIYQQHYNEKWGISPGKQGKDADGNPVARFEESAEKMLGEQAANIRSQIALGKKIDDEAAELLKNTQVGDNANELRRLATMDAETQKDVAETIAAAEEAGEKMTVLRAADLAAGKDPSTAATGVETPGERFIKALDRLDGTSRLALRLLREDINPRTLWQEQTKLDFMSQLLDIRQTCDKLWEILDDDVNPK